MAVSLRHNFTSPKADDPNAAADNRVLPSYWNAQHALTAAANTVLVRSGSVTGPVSDMALAASQLVGRGTTGDISPILLGAGLQMTGSTLSNIGAAPDLTPYALLSGAAFTGLLRSVSADGVTGALFNGASKGVRIIPSASVASIEGVDQTGVGSYQPLVVGGSTLNFQTGAISRMFIDGAGAVSVAGNSVFTSANINNWRPATTTRFSGFTIVAADAYGLHQCSGTFNVPLTAAGTLGDGFECLIQNTGGGAITLTPASGTIGGLATLVITPGSGIIRIRVANGNWVYAGQLYGEVTTPATSNVVDFNAIPLWANWIDILVEGVSTNGTDNYMLQLGTGGSLVSTGYVGSAQAWAPGGTGTGGTATVHFIVNVAPLAAGLFSGMIRLVKRAGNIWNMQASFSSDTSSRNGIANGYIALGGLIDRLRLATPALTNTFDAGNVTVRYGN